MTSSLCSFDVFDTVLTRLVGHPASLFVLLGGQLARTGLWPHSPQRFAASRIVAEAQARHHVHPSEVTLDAIYAELSFAHAIPPEAAQACARLEIELEGELLRAVPAARRAIDAARRAGHRVAFISDIYLPPAVIRGWLVREALATADDAVWVSSESGATKASGRLFERIREANPPGLAWRHVGDHPVSDVSMPRSLGIEAELCRACSLTRYENRMEQHAQATGGVASLLAGASRWLRLAHPADTASQAGLRDIAAGVAGPVLFAFVTWVLRSAQRQGLRRVWFTARDGQVMLRMARQIAPRLGADMELGYLYGGRQVVHLAGLEQIDERALVWLTGGAGVVTAEAVLERVGLRPDELADALRRHEIPTAGLIGWARVSALKRFFQDPTVEAAVLRVAAQRRADMRSYFTASGLIGGAPCAVVDIGWRGSVLRSMFDIIGPADAARHHFLYFGLFKRPADVPEARMAAFCFDASGTPTRGAAHDVPELTSVMEIFCQADHPQVLHVEPKGDVHVPRLRAPLVTPPTLWDVPYFQDCLDAFAAAVRIDLASDTDVDLRPLCGELLRTLMTTPDVREAEVLGSVQYVDDQSGTTAQAFAQPYSRADWRALARTGKLPRNTMTWWEQGAWALTPDPVRLCLRAARKIGITLRPASAAARAPALPRSGKS